MELEQVVTSTDQREASRFGRERDTEFALIVRSNGEHVVAEVRDESLGGVGLYLNDLAGIEAGQVVTIVYGQETYRAEVRHLDAQDGGEFHLGFHCSPVSD